MDPLDVFEAPHARVEVIHAAARPCPDPAVPAEADDAVVGLDDRDDELRLRGLRLLEEVEVASLVWRDQREAEAPGDREEAAARMEALWCACFRLLANPDTHRLDFLSASIEAIRGAIRRRHAGRAAGLRPSVEEAAARAASAVLSAQATGDTEAERDAWAQSVALGVAWADVLDDSTPERVAVLRDAVQEVTRG